MHPARASSRPEIRDRTASASISLSLALAAILASPFLGRATLLGQGVDAPPAVATIDPAEPIPNDPAVTTGELANGLRYYIRPNDLPENRAELRLVVNAGSMQEEDDERGLAHFVEHMAFNGTENFGPSELVEYLESIGMRFGSDLNASTSFDETVYSLQVPTDDADGLERAFLILGDWAHGITFDSAQIEAERGVIIEEWRARRGAGARMMDRQLPVMFAGSRYVDRLPIGEVEQISGFMRDDFLSFYRRWYRPDLMAVVAVGDFDPQEVESMIRERFGAIPMPTDPPPRTEEPVPGHPETLFSITTDPEATSTSVEVDIKRPRRTYRTVGDQRRGMVIGYLNSMFNNRLAELSLEPDAPFLGASAGSVSLGRMTSIDGLGAAVENGRVGEGLAAVLREARRVHEFGFTEVELDRSKTNHIRSLERAWAERENRSSGSYVSELVSHFLEGEPFPAIEWEYAVSSALVSTIGLEEIAAVTPDWFSESDRVVAVAAPERDAASVPGEDELRSVFERVALEELEPWEEEVLDAPLVADPPTPGAVISEERVEEIDLTIWELSNGVRVLLKPTDFRDDQVLMASWSPGGTSLLSDEEYIPVGITLGVVNAGGLGPFDQVELSKRLVGKAASVSASVEGGFESVSGSASPRDLETLFELTWLRFTAPRKDPQLLDVARTQIRATLENRGSSPAAAFGDTLNAVMTQGHPRARPPTVADLDRLDLDRAFDFYRDRFADAGDFIFSFVGAIDLETIRPLVERYLGGLPSTGRVESARDTGIDPPDGVIEKVVRRGLEPQARTQMVFAGPAEYSREGSAALGFLANALEVRLRERLREELGGTYGVSASGGLSKEPDEEYSLSIAFGSDPERVEELVEVVFAEIDSIRGGADIDTEIANRKEAARRALETAVETNQYWSGGLITAERNGHDPRELLGTAITDSVTAEMVVEAANLYLGRERYVRVTLLPEGGGS